MKQFFLGIWRFFFPLNNACDKNHECNTECEDREACECSKSTEVTDETVNSYPLVIELEEQKRKAIEACDGCEDEVLVLKYGGEEIGYYKSINDLYDKNLFPGSKSTVYRYWREKQKSTNTKLLFNKFEITKL
jgi:hypothetical protein